MTTNHILIKLDIDKKYDYKNFFIKELNNDNNNLFNIKQLISNKYLHNNLTINYKIYNFSHQEIELLFKKFNVKIISSILNFKYDLSQHFSNQTNIENILNNKRVVIVGPADYVDSNDEINKYDVIVRVNKGLSQTSNGKAGDRTDILYHVVNQHTENGGPINLNFKGHIRFIYPILDLYENSTFKNIGTLRDYFQIYQDKTMYNFVNKNFSIVNKNEYLEMEKILDSRPNAGVGAILDLLNFNIKELYITGFTLFQTNYDKNYRNTVDGIKGNTSKIALDRMKKANNHNQEKTALVFKNNILNNKKVKYDKILIDCINLVLTI